MTTRTYQVLPPDRAANDVELELLERWREEGLVARAIAGRPGAPEFVFYDGPPTANGRPGIHHVFARTVKDLFSRHRSMLGYHVPRKAGWDTHGLPVEIEVEKALGISGKQDIERIGVEEFNRRCRESVWKYREEWERLVDRVAHWLDYKDPYVTYSNGYIESEWWALKTLHEKGLLVQGHKILPYCPRCGTTLSSHEVAQGYEDVEDPSVYLALDLVEDPARAHGSPSTVAVPRRRIVVWTTTPWTLPSNAALAVHPDLTYVEVKKNGRDEWTLIMAESRAIAVLGQEWRSKWEVVGRFTGRELEGMRYRRPLDWLEYPEGEHEVIIAEDFVLADDGSGVVHMSPAFGADDYAAGQRRGLAFLQPVNARGEFPAEMPVVGGKFVKEADALIIEELKRRDVLWKAATMTHSYPHCWRCRTPLLYYARGSWFVRTTAFRDRMLARNAAVDWHPPEVGEGRFGAWLENNIDWAISRDRYWGTPLPVWMNDADPTEIEVIGSYAELAERHGAPLPADFDPHKPYIDAYTWPAKSGTGTMRRVSEVIDAWFDSGSMPFAQWHYPFEHRETVAREYPADYIAEGLDQTRGWFYSLLAIATGLGDALPNNADPVHAGDAAAPYKAVVVNDLVRDAKGLKMSKSRGNAVDPWSVMERHGADAVRLFLVASSQVWTPRNFDEQVIREGAGRFLLTLKNVYKFWAELANFGWAPSAADPAPADRPLLDRWVLSRLAEVEAEANRQLTAFDATNAARAVMAFVDDDVSKWYVRLSRDRFYDVTSADNRAAFATLHEVLVVSCRLLAPFAPFVTDWIHRELTGASVHLADYVRPSPYTAGAELDAAMREVRAIVTLGRAQRESVGIGVRQPLGDLFVFSLKRDARYPESLNDLVKSELNLKQVTVATDFAQVGTAEAKADFKVLGKRAGKDMKALAAAIEGWSAEQVLGVHFGATVNVAVEDRVYAVGPEDVKVVLRGVATDGTWAVALDTTLTPALRAEGMARELVSRVQRLRKESGLAVSDRIRLEIAGPDAVQAAAEEHRQWIAGETLAVEVAVGAALGGGSPAVAVELDGGTAHIALTRDR
ncbi:MAG: isoleucine--tRNA ligase [Gemmatimonadetes bacterium]|nr:isoleucine--tRNA ligase [Gemmatimonadota bacterium]MBI3567329.1 isoleucine--tRNA ligase [Gemmatimonadota bacterium]